jgi:hypothetical protein
VVRRVGALHRFVVVIGGRVVDVVVAVAADGDGIDAGSFVEQIAV